MNVAALQFSRSMGRTSRLTFDPVLISSALALLLLGLVMVTSASISIADRELGSPFAFLERQLLFASVGCCLGLVAFVLPTEVWERASFALLLIGLALLVLVLVPGLGHAVNGSRRWLRMGMFNFQASELARLLILIHICSYAVRRHEELRSTLKGVLKPLGLLALAALLLLLEPDFGAAAVLLITGFAILFIAGISWRQVLLVLGIGGLALGAIAVSSAYRVRRLTTFLPTGIDHVQHAGGRFARLAGIANRPRASRTWSIPRRRWRWRRGRRATHGRMNESPLHSHPSNGAIRT